MWSCKHCKVEFDYSSTSQKANHSRWCADNPSSYDTSALKAAQLRVLEEKLGPKTTFAVKCERCSEPFEVVERASLFPSRKVYFCSRSCANHRGEGLEWGSGKRTITQYKAICFAHHERKCVACDEKLIVEVHHLDENHQNNDPMNLIPMCPTHHQYWHSKHRHLVEPVVEEYIQKWRLK